MTFAVFQAVTKKLERAANKTKNWKHKVSKQEGLLRIIPPGDRVYISQMADALSKSTRLMFFMYFSGTKSPVKMTNWGQAAFSDKELDELERIWQENKNRSYDGQ